MNTKILPLLPLRAAVLFPGTTAPFEVARPRSVALADALRGRPAPQYVLAFSQRDAKTDDPGAGDIHAIGTVARVLGVTKEPSGNPALVVEGVARARLVHVVSADPYFEATYEEIAEPEGTDEELSALRLSLKEKFAELASLQSQLPREVAMRIDAADGAGALADVIAMYLDITVDEKAAVLALLDPKERAREVLKLVTRRIELVKVKERIQSQVKDEIGKTHREHMLRQQMKAIQEELGHDDDGEKDIDELVRRVEEASLTDEARDVAKKQLKRLRAMQPGSPEYPQVRTYLDWILDLPWIGQAREDVDIGKVRAALEADHYGLERVKKRILEHLAVRKLKADGRAPILCLVGPPGVGKTSLGKSIAGAMGRSLQRLSLGGVHDEAAIRGHRRTYVGALPGQFVQAMKKAKSVDPVLVLDEIDKLGSGGMRGDPASALLEVLDPEQNNTFTDHYLEIPYDLSKVLFIATANTSDTIPGPLKDRMEVIEIPGYTRAEKLAIARRHLVPKQLSEHGLTEGDLEITDAALSVAIERYTREAGVRSLERQIAAMARAVAVLVAEGARTGKRVVDSDDDVRKLLGAPRFTDEVAERTEDAGVATGLAWTPTGGHILFVEATRMPGKGKLTLTGQLGDVMKESATAALSFIRANASSWGIDANFLDASDLHIHVPAGAIQKDGPSAGVTILTALVSLLTGVRVRHDVAMTGEITLRGRVLPIGGLKEKVLAAHRAGVKRVIVPERNRADMSEVPEETTKDLEIIYVDRMDDVLAAALEVPPLAAPRAAPVMAAPAQ